jgi:hypothetical protein
MIKRNLKLRKFIVLNHAFIPEKGILINYDCLPAHVPVQAPVLDCFGKMQAVRSFRSGFQGRR